MGGGITYTLFSEHTGLVSTRGVSAMVVYEIILLFILGTFISKN